MSIEKIREEFEDAWADVMRGDDPPPGRKPTRSKIDPERYAGDAASFAWRWWQRSRGSLVIALPAIRAEDYCPLSSAAYREECREVIEAAGLKVKP